MFPNPLPTYKVVDNVKRLLHQDQTKWRAFGCNIAWWIRSKHMRVAQSSLENAKQESTKLSSSQLFT